MASIKSQIGARCRAAGIARPDNGKTPSGAIVWAGHSAWDARPIMVVLSWSGCTEEGKGANTKTGKMVQSYVLPIGGPGPVAEVQNGAAATICGDCPHMKIEREKAKKAGLVPAAPCYVNTGQGPRAIFDGAQRSIYPTVSMEQAAGLMAGMPVRFGTYGDPGMAPAEVWTDLAAVASYWTGYTHRYADTGAGLKGVCMASADSLQEMQDLAAAGWATFRVSTDPSEPRQKGEARCPASAEAGRKVTCETCPIKCNGRILGAERGRIFGRVILDHGPGGIGRAIARLAKRGAK